MRFNFTVLAVVAASVAHGKSSFGVSGLPNTYDDDPEPVNDNHDAVSAQRNLEALATPDSGERMVDLKLTDSLENAKAVVSNFREPKPLKHYQPSTQDVLREHNMFTKLLDLFTANRPSLDSFLRSFESTFKVGGVASKLIEATKSDNFVIRGCADKLLQGLLQLWIKANIPVGRILESLNLPSKLRVLSEVDYRKIEALGLYIDLVNKLKKDQPTLIETLAKKYGDAELSKALKWSMFPGPRGDYAETLLRNLMDSWKDMKLSVNDVFKILKIENSGPTVLDTAAPLILKDYVEHLGMKDVLSVLTEGFGGELKFAGFAAEASKKFEFPKAPEYLYELLQRWKRSGKQLDELEKELLALHPAEPTISSWDELILYYYRNVLHRPSIDKP